MGEKLQCLPIPPTINLLFNFSSSRRFSLLFVLSIGFGIITCGNFML